MILAEIQKIEIDEKSDLNELQITSILEKMIKQRNDAIAQFEQAKRQELADKEKQEIEIIKEFLPEQMSDDEISELVSKIISEVFLNNGNAAYRKEVWLENKFDEKLTGLEDIDLGKKAKANNWEIFYCAEANVEHLHRESFKTIQNRYRREAEAMKNINKDLKSDVHIIKNTFFHCFKGFLRGVRYDVKTSKDSLQPNSDIISILKYRFSQYVGTYKGYKNDMSKNKMTDLYFYPPKV